MTCRTARIGAARAWPTVTTDPAAQDRIEALEREVATLRTQLATERDLADDLRDRVWQLEDEVGGYRIALAETTAERDRLRRDAERMAAEYADAIATGARLEDEADELCRQVDEWQQAAVDRLAEVGRLQASLNRARQWERQADGTWHHVETAEVRDA